MQIEDEKTTWLDKPLIPAFPAVKIETVLIVLIMILAIFSRLYILGARTMSHDEVNHVVPSFELSQGQGYAHDPITHGPFQFHVVALTYFLLGDSDFTSRLPAALFNVATIFFAWWGFRRYLGRTGALIAAFLLLISPYSLFYGRYTRNEAFVGLWALLLLYGILRYLDTGKARFLYVTTLALVMHFVTKETSFIYAAQALVFLAVIFFVQLARKRWAQPQYFQRFILALMATIVLLVGGLMANKLMAPPASATDASTATATTQTATDATAEAAATRTPVSPIPLAILGLGVVAAAVAVVFAVKGFSLAGLRNERSFDLLILIGTLVLPQLSAFPVKLLGYDPLNYNYPGYIPTAIVVVVLILASLGIGLWWKPKLWLRNAALFYAIFIVLYTTVFTNGVGVLTGMVGSLGYWLNQQGVQRGEQPIYYFALLQIPMYEYLPALGTLMALFLGWRLKAYSVLLPKEAEAVAPVEAETFATLPEIAVPDGLETTSVEEGMESMPERLPVLALFLYWAFTSLAAYSVAGEKMPWLTYHIVVPMVLCAAWAFGYLVDTTAWSSIRRQKGWLVALVVPVFLLSLAGTLGSLLGENLPFQGSELAQLEATANFVFSLLVTVASGWGLARFLADWSSFQIRRVFTFGILAVLAVLTARAAMRASYINYDNPTEFLVYAHGASGPKEILKQVEDISQRTTGGLDIAVAYDSDALYPFWWYFRHYPNKFYYADNPTRDLRNYPVVIVSEDQFSAVEPIVQNDYYEYDYFRLWWPMQEYFSLKWDNIANEWAADQTVATGAQVLPASMTVFDYFGTAWGHISPFFTSAQVREAVLDIWLNADYTQWAALKGEDTLRLTNWEPSDKIRLYVRKDIASQLWDYGVQAQQTVTDPYEAGKVALSADQIIGTMGSEAGQFQSPRGIAVASDGTLYVADAKNNRIQHLATDGTVLASWGTYGSIDNNAPGGSFNEPWGIAVGPDGSVYVADTWNNRVQKFTADGQFVTMWGTSGQAETPDAFWGPRGLAVDATGRVYVTDTGNKRVVVFDADGNYITQFGSTGYNPGQFDEPVGIAVDAAGNVYVADTWNQRVQVFTPDAAGTTYTPSLQWNIDSWFGESLDNKPFLAVDNAGNVYVADPEGPRVLQFTTDGAFVRSWGSYGSGADSFSLVSGVASDGQGGVWVVDSGNNRVMHFTLP